MRSANKGRTQKIWMYSGPVSLALMANAGQIKGNPLLAWLPIDLTLVATLLVFIGCLTSRIKFGPAVGYVALPLILWVAFLSPIGLSHLDSYGVSKIITLFSITFLAAISPFYLLRFKEQRTAFLISLAVLAGAFSTSALVLAPTTANDFSNRLVFEGSNTIGTGRVALIGAIIFVVWLMIGRFNLRSRLIFIIGIVLTVALGVMTGSAGPTVATAASLTLVVLFAPSFARRRLQSIVGIFLVAAIAIAATFARNSDGMDRIVDTLSGEATTSIGARTELWEDALDQIPLNPFGVGWGMFESEYLEHRYPHNLFLEVGIEAGWLPVVLLGLLMFVTMIRGIQLATGPTMTVFLALFVFSFLNSMISSDVNGTRLLWVVMFAIWVLPLNGQDVKRSNASGDIQIKQNSAS